jgi:hypothetical protein
MNAAATAELQRRSSLGKRAALAGATPVVRDGKRRAGERDGRALNTFARIPTEPHPDNLKLVITLPRECLPNVQEWLKAHIAEGRARAAASNTGFVSWIGCEDLARQIEARLEDLARHPDRPLRPITLKRLRVALESMLEDLPKTRPF